MSEAEIRLKSEKEEAMKKNLNKQSPPIRIAPALSLALNDPGPRTGERPGYSKRPSLEW